MILDFLDTGLTLRFTTIGTMMNERIKELAVKAQIYFSYDRGPGTDNELQAAEITQSDLEKFAELIVRECVSVGRTAFLNDHSTVPVFPAENIKQHFGVEE